MFFKAVFIWGNIGQNREKVEQMEKLSNALYVG